MKKLVLLACCAMLFVVPASTQGQVGFGPQVSWGSDADIGIGARVVFGLDQLVENLEGIVSGDYFFIDCGSGDCSWIEFNGNVALPLDVSPTLNPYVGGGLNVTRISVDLGPLFGGDVSNTEVGLNLLGGLKFPMPTLTPFVEARLTVGGGEQFVLTGGFTVGGRR